jgi:hypothetical protein
MRPFLHSASQDLEPVVTVRLAIHGDAGGYRALDQGDLLVTSTSPHEAAAAVAERVHRRAYELAALKGWLRIHGAVIGVAGARVGVVGRAGAGKTTLSVAAVVAGQGAEADESFVVRGGVAIAVPRRFQVEPGTVELVPEARNWAEASPLLGDGSPVRSLDPRDAGHDWTVRSAPLDALVILSDPHADPEVRTLPTNEGLPLLLRHALPTIEARSAIAREIAGLLRATPVLVATGGHRAGPVGLLELLAAVVHRG